jgi:hypothetical protein
MPSPTFITHDAFSSFQLAGPAEPDTLPDVDIALQLLNSVERPNGCAGFLLALNLGPNMHVTTNMNVHHHSPLSQPRQGQKIYTCVVRKHHLRETRL